MLELVIEPVALGPINRAVVNIENPLFATSDVVLVIITAVVLGGSSICGGQGAVLGTFLACLVRGFLLIGMTASMAMAQDAKTAFIPKLTGVGPFESGGAGAPEKT